MMTILRFEMFELDRQNRELRRAGAPTELEPQVLDLLIYLIENRDHVVSKDELIDHVWNGRIVSDSALSSRLNAVRKALGDDGKAQRLIRTASKHGYRFVGEVTEGETVEHDDTADKDTPATREATPQSLSNKPSIAVLAFENLSGDPEQEYFSDGITEDIITAVSRVRHFHVTARNSTFSYKNQPIDVRRVSAELGVRYVLQGSVRKSGQKVRITAQLIDGETGNHLWAERYDRNLEDIFAVQDEITNTVVGSMQPEITRSEIERARQKPPNNLDAWDLYQRGLWHFFHNTKEEIAAAADLFVEAIAADPEFITPYVGLVECHVYDLTFGYTERDPHEAMAPARKAVELDPQSAYAHKALGLANFIIRDHKTAIAEFELAIQLNPSDAHFYPYLAFSLSFAGQAERALDNVAMAIRLSPRDPMMGWFNNSMAVAYLHLQRHEECIAWARRALQYPNAPWPVRTYLISALAHLDRLEEAKAALAEVLALRPDFTISRFPQLSLSTDQTFIAHHAAGLRKAGVPE